MLRCDFENDIGRLITIMNTQKPVFICKEIRNTLDYTRSTTKIFEKKDANDMIPLMKDMIMALDDGRMSDKVL